MNILKIKPHLSETELKKAMHSQKSTQDFKDYQIIYSVMVNQGKKASEIADILCVTKSKIYKTVEKYNKYGALWKANIKRGGRREARCIMSLTAEKEFLKSVEKDAIKGQIITFRQIKERLERHINRSVSDDYIWDIFKRHGWSKKVPRQSHPHADKKEQEEYNKNSQKIWQPNR